MQDENKKTGIMITRGEWEKVAKQSGSGFINIQVKCFFHL